MPADFHHLRYVLPRFRGNYTVFMKTLQSGCAFDDSDIAKFRLKVLEVGKKYGWKAVKDAFGVGRSTYFLWRKKSLSGRLSSLVPRSTRPRHVRQMRVDLRITCFIREVREQYGRIGKEKLEVLLGAYCHQLGIVPIRATAIGKIIKRNHFFFEGKKKYVKKRPGVFRVRHAPREKDPGYIEMDSVIVYVTSRRYVFITALDVVTKYAQCLPASTNSSSHARQLLEQFRSSYQFPIRTVQTDNGSEFLGAFEAYCQHHQIPHVFTYPRSPRINGGVERFNRTIQEEFIDRSDSLLQEKAVISLHLQRYLSWYNDTRPHQALGYRTPSQYIQSLKSNM